MKNGVLLPLHHGLTNEMFEKLHSVIDEFISLFINIQYPLIENNFNNWNKWLFGQFS